MKRILPLLGILALAISLNSCKKYKNKEVYANVPVYMDYSDFRNSFEFSQGKMMENAGNIYLHNNFILVNDIDKGIHVYDNTDPGNPFPIGFMNIPGNTQMAVKGTTLYADSFMDLLVVDISNMYDPKKISREQEVFTYSLPMINEGYPIADIDMSKGVVIDWKIEKTKEVSGFMAKFNVKDCEDCSPQEVETKSAVSARVNLAGSMSQFGILDNYLYALDVSDIKSFDISNPQNTIPGSARRTWEEVETIFPNGNHLYIGTTTGMMIYDASMNRLMPEYISTAEHVRSCDPVFVDGDYAYLTVRSGSDCAGDINQMQVYDVSNKYLPNNKDNIQMTDPHGLAKDGNLVFVCDGDDGLKIYNASSSGSVSSSPQYHYPDIKSRDIILHNGLAIMIAEDGIYQYDYSDPSNIIYAGILTF
ncbi:MAG: hypothetical protein HUJ25_18055 [Crocinitomicaceae bacterium]|nr:hypothetical protein [Crocinitomicaceae bacterium]